MKRIVVNSLPLKDIIRDLATELKTTYSQSCDQYILDIPKQYGKGQIMGVNFENGMGILVYDCEFLEDFEFQFIINEIHPLKFLFCLNSKLQHRFEDESEVHEIGQYQNAIVASSKHNGHILCFKKNERTIIHSLELTRNKFIHNYSCELKSLSRPIAELFKDVTAKKKFYYLGFYSLQLADLFEEIHFFEHGSFLKKIFLEGKCYEILTKQLLQYEDDLKNENNRTLLRISEIKKVKEAAQLIDREGYIYHNLKIISEKVGLNQGKLQSGFQYLYKVTIHQYLQNSRLELSKILLLDPENTINDVLFKTGITSRSYFSKLFKDKFGLTPSKYRSMYRNNVNNLNK